MYSATEAYSMTGADWATVALRLPAVEQSARSSGTPPQPSQPRPVTVGIPEQRCSEDSMTFRLITFFLLSPPPPPPPPPSWVGGIPT